MTNNSIDYITKKHFRSGIRIAVVLLAVAAAGLSAYLSVMNGLRPAFVAFAAFCSLGALFSFISLFSAKTGCTLLRMAVSVNAFACFFSGMAAFTLGYLFIRHNGTQDQINELLACAGSGTIATRPPLTGALLFAVSFILYFASGCAFFAHRYLGAARSCSERVLKRNGFRAFPLFAFILFILAVCAAVVFLALSGQAFLCGILSDGFSTLLVILMALLALHLLFSGLCARSFARKTFAFKVFEKQVMKVETNADGTVYVPINEDREPDAEEELAPVKKKEPASESQRGKPFIRDFVSRSDEAAESILSPESGII